VCYNYSGCGTNFYNNTKCDDQDYCTIDFVNAQNNTCEYYPVATCDPTCANYSSNGISCYNKGGLCDGICSRGNCECPHQEVPKETEKIDHEEIAFSRRIWSTFYLVFVFVNIYFIVRMYHIFRNDQNIV
jgi:hypothetical protein